MQFSSEHLAQKLTTLRNSRSSADRALADNFVFEERVTEMRRTDFEGFDAATISIRKLQSDYFKTEVQGARHTHIPTTFRAINSLALYGAEIEPNEKLIRLERVDEILVGAGCDFETLHQALQPRSPDEALKAVLAEQWKVYPGARPSFVAFKSEVADDLKATDWLMRLRNRLGLGHFSPAPGERQSFVLLEYKVSDVLSEWERLKTGGAERAFAYPTVLEAPGSPHFFPSPAGLASSFAVDLSEAGRALASIRELLHVRISYRAEHLVRAGQLVGPLPPVRLSAARDTHLDRLRSASGRADLGAYMSGEVDD